MEARANYVAVGAFVLVVLALILVGSLWFARVQFATEYQYIETKVAGPVSGIKELLNLLDTRLPASTPVTQ